jgi:hypothetical protein
LFSGADCREKNDSRLHESSEGREIVQVIPWAMRLSFRNKRTWLVNYLVVCWLVASFMYLLIYSPFFVHYVFRSDDFNTNHMKAAVFEPAFLSIRFERYTPIKLMQTRNQNSLFRVEWTLRAIHLKTWLFGMLHSVNWYLYFMGQSIGPIFKGEEPQNRRRLVTTNQRCVTSQMGEDLIYTTTEVWNHGRVLAFGQVFLSVTAVIRSKIIISHFTLQVYCTLLVDHILRLQFMTYK